MLKRSIFVVAALSTLLLGFGGSALAGRGLGLGVEGMIDSRDFVRSVPALYVVYDMDKFRFGGLFGFNITTNSPGGPTEKIFKFGGQFFYKVHGNQTADFSIGSLLGMRIIGNYAGSNQTDVAFLLGIGAQVRAFIVTNVSLNVGLGFGLLIDVDDNKGPTVISLSGDLMATIGLTYYF